MCWISGLLDGGGGRGGLDWGVGEVGRRKKLCHFIIFSKNLPHVIVLALNIMKLLRLLSALSSCQVF